MNKLKVGDIIYSDSYGKITGKYTIHRVTEKMAFAKVNSQGYELKFQIEYGSWLKLVGKTERWDHASYYVETPELKEKYERMLMLQKLDATTWGNFPTDKIREIMDIVNTVEKH